MKVKAPLENLIRFSVNEEKRTVVCIIHTVIDYEMPFAFCNGGDEVIVKGIAKCSKDDKFDVTLGKRIAESRAKVALFRELKNKSLDLFKETKQASIEYNLQAVKYDNLITKEKQHIENLVK